MTRKVKPESLYRRLRYELSKTKARAPFVHIRHRQFRPADVFFGSYPRSGSTWSRFVLFELLTGREATFESVNGTFRGVGRHADGPVVLAGGGRLISTHERYRPEYKKAIYLVRDGRDVLLSEYAYLKALGRFQGGLDKFVDAFLRGKINGYGPWQRHICSWLESGIANTEDMLVLRFEEARSDPEKSFNRVASFLGLQVKSEDLRRIIANNSLEKMRAKEDRMPQKASVRGRFVRQGSVEKWRSELSQEQLSLIQQLAGDALERLEYPTSATPEKVTAQTV
jgi:hypothetical protein